MSVVESPRTAGLIQRVQNILLKPTAEWDVIEAEPATVQGLYLGYACILAAIPAVASVIGSMLVGHWFIILAIIGAVLTYVLQLVGVFVIALIVDALAPSFGAQKNRIQALKLVVYSYTAFWVAGVLNIIPWIAILAALVGLYSLYLMYLGLPKLMKSPADKTLGYFLVSLAVSIVVYGVLAMIVGAIIGVMAFSVAATGVAAVGAAAH